MKPIRVLIVEDSAVIREFLRHCIGRDSRLEVCATVSTAEEALRILERLAPDVISLDIHLPGMNGLEATRQIMLCRPTPIVVVSASVRSEDLKITMKALEAGALSVLEKPVGSTHHEYEAMAERLCTQLAIMSQVKVIRQHGRSRRPAADASQPREPNPAIQHSPEILGIASSTGGPGTLAKILCGLGAEFPLPIVAVQHIASSFVEGFAAWLGSVCPFKVIVAKGGEVPVRGHLYIAPPDRHLRMGPGVLRLDNGVPLCGQKPSGTVLFQSMARSLGGGALGLVLTGMGEDGAEGLLEIRRAGGYTIAEHESTAIVYGMPGAAVRLDAVRESLPLPEIAPRLLQLVVAKEGPALRA